MKNLIFAVILLGLSLAHARVNDTFLLTGKVKSFDEKKVKIETHLGTLVVPRKAIPSKYKFQIDVMTNIPIVTEQVKAIKVTRNPASEPLKVASFEKELKALKAEFKKRQKSKAN